MNINKSILAEYERTTIMLKCLNLYKEGVKEKDIGEALGISPVHVSRNIQRALEMGLGEIGVEPPHDDITAEELRELYRLREVKVFPIGIQEEITDILGKLTATYLENVLAEEAGRINRIAIGPGRTMRAFVMSLSSKRRPEMNVGSTVALHSEGDYVASNTIVGIPTVKWACKAFAFETQMPDERQRDYADILLFGLGNVRDIIYHDIQVLTNVDHRELTRAVNRLETDDDAVGIINYRPIDIRGMPLPWNIAELDVFIHNNSLKPGIIREMASDCGKRVICVSGGLGKEKGIKGALEGGYFNTLITDYETASRILGMKEQNEGTG